MNVYVDESARHSAGGLYVVAAVAVAQADVSDLRARVRRLTPSKRRFHWHSEEPVDRMAAARLVVDSPARAVWAIEAQPCAPSKHERARRKALETLAVLVHTQGGGELVIESRQERNDALDRKVLARLSSFELPTSCTYRHARPDAEPLLWLPDVVAGAVAADLVGRDRQYAELMRSRVDRLAVFP